MGYRSGAGGVSVLRAVLSFVREQKACRKGSGAHRSDDGVFCGGTCDIRSDTVFQACYGNSGNGGDVFRTAGRVYDGRNVGTDIEYMVRAGRMDAVSDVLLGIYRLAGRYAEQKSVARKAADAVYLRSACGRAVFACDGYVDGAFRRRSIHCGSLAAGACNLAADDGGVLRIERGVSACA